jgi:uncharacterized membrane protein
MTRFLLLSVLPCLLSLRPALAEEFQRPIPASQTATVELWFALAALTFAASLVAVQWLVARR